MLPAVCVTAAAVGELHCREWNRRRRSFSRAFLCGGLSGTQRVLKRSSAPVSTHEQRSGLRHFADGHVSAKPFDDLRSARQLAVMCEAADNPTTPVRWR
jgi:hypothetical protein